MPSILVVEDHGLLAAALLRILRERGGYDVPAVMTTAEQALEQLPDLKVDLALVDVSLPSMSGIDLVALVRIQYPKLPCLMLSGHNAAQYVDRSVRAGARGYILKEDISGILEGIAAVLSGGTYFSNELHWG
jgi:DNA-binding NarL/FixJ family response regulator